MANGGDCAGEILDMVTEVFNEALSLATADDDPVGAITDTIKLVKAFDFPICS